MQNNVLVNHCVNALEDIKALDIKCLNVSKLTDITDTMIICSGTSTTHIKSMSNNLIKAVKENGFTPLGLEGGDLANWVLIDLGEVIIHLMLPDTREFYDLESLWEMNEGKNANLST